jgi:chromosome segregation ATPase
MKEIKAMGKRKEVQTSTSGVDSAVSSACEGMNELKEELESWRDNLPENLQNGSKADELNEAIDAIDGVSEIDVPDAAEGLECTYHETKQKSRSDRRNYYCGMLSAASDAVRDRISELEALEYEDGVLVVNGTKVNPNKHEGSDPAAEDERDSAVTELETFADEIENAQSEYENVNFPGMR